MGEEVMDIAFKRLQRYGAGLLTSIALIGLMPSEALACRWYDAPCKARKAAQRAIEKTREAARRAQDEARRVADESRRVAEAAAREAERMAREAALAAYQAALDAAFRDLRAAGLGALADVSRFTDPDMWLREATYVLVNNVVSNGVMVAEAEVTDYIKNQVGNFSESYPFGDGPVGRQIEIEVRKAYSQAVLGVPPQGQKAIDYLNPLNNPIYPSPEDYTIAKDAYQFDMPPFLQFGFGTALQIKPLEVAIDADKRIPFVLKGSVQTTFPLLWGDINGESTIFVNAIKDQKFKFQVGVAYGIGSRKTGADSDPKASLQEGLNFDVTCSTVERNKCQLTKISSKVKVDVQRKPGAELTGQVKRAMSSVLAVTGPMATLGIISTNDRIVLDSALQQIASAAELPSQFADSALAVMLMPRDIANKALTRQSDLGVVSYLFAALSAFDLNMKVETTKPGYKQTFSISDIESADISYVNEWRNADTVKGVFKPGFSFSGYNPRPDFVGLEVSLKIGTEAKLKAGNVDTKNSYGVVTKANESEIGISANVNTSSSFGVMFPLKAASMSLLPIDGSAPSYELSELQNLFNFDDRSFGDRIGLGASKYWQQPAELQQFNTQVEDLADKLNAGSFFVITSAKSY